MYARNTTVFPIRRVLLTAPIDAIIAVATSNGLRNLDDHDFQLLYARRATGNSKDRMIARIVAVKDGVIRAKIEPEEDGEDQLQAFSALRKDIEVKLDRILMTVPEQLHDAGEAGASVSNGVSRARSDAPPAYTGPEVGILASKAGR